MLFTLMVILLFSLVAISFLSSWKKVLPSIGLYLSFLMMLFGIYVFFIKSGGFSFAQMGKLLGGSFLYGYIGGLPIRFNSLAQIISAGRLLFASFFLLEGCRRNLRIRNIAGLYPILWSIPFIPTISFFILTGPRVFSSLFGYRFALQNGVVTAEYLLLIAMVLLGLAANLAEYYDIMLSWIKKQELNRVISRLLLALQYLFFAYFEPVMVFQNFSSVKISRGFLPLIGKDRILTWSVLFALFLLSTIIIFVQDWRFYHYDYNRTKSELTIRQKTADAAVYSSALIHGMKNQLLASQILVTQLQTKVEALDNPDLAKTVKDLVRINDTVRDRLDMVYRSFVKVSTVLSPCDSSLLFAKIREKIDTQHGDRARLSYTIAPGVLLCDQELLSEAICCVIDNALDAVEKLPSGQVLVNLSYTRAKTVITILDNGKGMPEGVKSQLFTPFTSTKNSQTNWGMGLCYANMIVRKHQGEIRCEKSDGTGTLFVILLPRFTKKKGK